VKTSGGKKPELNALDPQERRMAEAIIFLRNKKRENNANK